MTTTVELILCNYCNAEKPAAAFSKRGLAWTAKRSMCRECFAIRYKKYNKKHRDKDPIYCGERDWRGHIRRTFNLTFDDYCNMLESQGGGCAICGTWELHLAVDHCHTTGIVRGLLCRNCNHGIGNFKDSPERLASAIAYLQATTANTKCN
jgi:hypothetical protein